MIGADIFRLRKTGSDYAHDNAKNGDGRENPGQAADLAGGFAVGDIDRQKPPLPPGQVDWREDEGVADTVDGAIVAHNLFAVGGCRPEKAQQPVVEFADRQFEGRVNLSFRQFQFAHRLGLLRVAEHQSGGVDQIAEASLPVFDIAHDIRQIFQRQAAADDRQQPVAGHDGHGDDHRQFAGEAGAYHLGDGRLFALQDLFAVIAVGDIRS